VETVIVDGVRKSFGGERVLNGITLHVRKGEALGIVGPNGCGKTTLLRIIAGLLQPDEGRVLVKGSVSMVPQENLLLPWKTIRGNIELGPRIRGADKHAAKKAAEEAAELLGITEYLDMYPGRVSGGTARKATIARALALKPEILLLDEPYTGLDVKSIASLQASLKKLKGEVTMIVVSHQLGELLELVDRIVLLSHKPTRVIKVIELGKPGEKHKVLGDLRGTLGLI